MRRSDRLIESAEEVEEILKSQRIMRLGLVDGDRPYVVPVNFGYSEGRLYFHCAKEGRKLDLIAVNPHVAFEVESDVEVLPGEKSCGWTTKFRSVLGTGTAFIAANEDEVIRGLNAIMAHHGATPGDYHPQALAKTCVVRIEIESMTGKCKR